MRKVQHIWRGGWLIAMLSVAGMVSAQEQARLSERALSGTARYVGMGGAMTAVGGDPSAVKDNPAGLGVYRRMEVSITMGSVFDQTMQAGSGWSNLNKKFEMPQVSWSFHFGNPYRTSGVIANNFMVSYNRVRQYQREYTAAVSGCSGSLADVIALKTNGLEEQYLQPEGRWNDTEIGWLSLLGYDTYMINPLADNQWAANLQQGEKVNSAIHVRERGYMDEYALDWGMNISNRWYVGAGIRMTSFYLSQTEQYAEEAQQSDVSLSNYSTLLMSGLGVNGAIGMIGHPLEWLRFGVSFITPTASTLSITNYGEMRSKIGDSTYTATTPSNTASYDGLSLPLRLSTSLAFQWKRYGMIAFQYDYAHHKYLDDVHTLKVGLEVVPVQRLFINAGYVYESTFRNSDRLLPYALSYNAVETNTHALYTRSTQYISCGVGYRGKNMIVQAAYQYQLQDLDFQLHELCITDGMRGRTHRFVVTLGWHNR
ncbi:MAG: hypothetical protein ACI4BD_04630 [Paludibacteraceae bacterium]